MTTLYLGLERPKGKQVIHCPLIEIVPRPKQSEEVARCLAQLETYTHLIFTSKTAVKIWVEYCEGPDKLQNKSIFSVGAKTTATLEQLGLSVAVTAADERAEGVVAALKEYDLRSAHLFWPHSALARDVIPHWLKENEITHTCLPLYDTITKGDAIEPDWSRIDHIFFTSPSTVEAFWQLWGPPPEGVTLETIGEVTRAALRIASSLPPLR